MTQDQFDAMDFSDNEIKKLENFPRYKRLSSLLLCNNHVSKISEDLGTSLPNLSCLILTNNKVRPLARQSTDAMPWGVGGWGIYLRSSKSRGYLYRLTRPRTKSLSVVSTALM